MPTRTDIAVLRIGAQVGELVALDRAGRRGGYNTLTEAIDANRWNTRGDSRKAVAILHRDGRYYAQHVLAKLDDASAPGGLRGVYLDIERRSNVHFTPFNQHEALRAIVDGATVIVSRNAQHGWR